MGAGSLLARDSRLPVCLAAHRPLPPVVCPRQHRRRRGPGGGGRTAGCKKTGFPTHSPQTPAPLWVPCCAGADLAVMGGVTAMTSFQQYFFPGLMRGGTGIWWAPAPVPCP